VPLTPEMRELLKKGEIQGISDPNQRTIRIYVEKEEDLLKLPSEIMVAGVSVPVEGIVSGRFLALQPRTGRWRPSPGGVSIGNFNITAGTLGSRVYDNTTGERLILSNAHVLVYLENPESEKRISQPGPFDDPNKEINYFANLVKYHELKEPPEENLIDAALALPLINSDLSDQILDIGLVNGIEDAKIGMKVAKSGRTSGYTEAIVQDTSATIKVYGYPWGYTIFSDQIITDLLGEPGDSGSLVVNPETKNAVGLLFAGSDTLTAINKIKNICDLLNVNFGVPSIPSPVTRMSLLPFFISIPLLTIGTIER